jgi:hypothetical protein
MGGLWDKLSRIANYPPIRRRKAPINRLQRLSDQKVYWMGGIGIVHEAAVVFFMWRIMPNLTLSQLCKERLCIVAHLLYFGILTMFFICLAHYTRRWRKTVLDMNYMVCPQCHYNLQGLPRRHTCPECGRPYDADELQRQWEKDFPATK